MELIKKQKWQKETNKMLQQPALLLHDVHLIASRTGEERLKEAA
jgi:hypothetical protein